ncbi:MAG: prenyltransferase/squalene oxidase repeat-containing protein [Candidatus Brocadiia bacterium]
MADDRFKAPITEETPVGRESELSLATRSSLEVAPWIVASVMIHLLVIAALVLLKVGGQSSPAEIDITASLKKTATPGPTVEKATSEPDEELDDESEEILDEDVGDEDCPEDESERHYSASVVRWPARTWPTTNIGVRKLTLTERGGNQFSEKSVAFGLKWLADHQEADGHWDSSKWDGNGSSAVGITGLALLAFAGAGHTERSGKYSRVVRKAIEWLASQQDAKGNFAPGETMYSHAIPTLALLEEVAMAPVPRTQAIAKKGLDYIVSVQNDYKAWRCWPKDNENDTSVTTWCVMAMKAAKVAGYDVPQSAWAGAKNFLDEVTDPDSGEVGYISRPTKGTTVPLYERYSMTACGMFCRLYMGMSREDRLIKNGALILMENSPQWVQPGYDAQFSYYWYFGSLVLFQIEGDFWKKWNPLMRDMLISHQNMTPGELNGSWNPSQKTDFTGFGGRVYSTAMATLSLEVYYWYEIISRPKASRGVR